MAMGATERAEVTITYGGNWKCHPGPPVGLEFRTAMIYHILIEGVFKINFVSCFCFSLAPAFIHPYLVSGLPGDDLKTGFQ